MSCGNEPIARWQAGFRLPAVPFRYNPFPDDSPVAGIRTKYSCKTCLYAWRSIEPEENTNPDKSGAVPGEAGQLAEISCVPAIPLLRRVEINLPPGLSPKSLA